MSLLGLTNSRLLPTWGPCHMLVCLCLQLTKTAWWMFCWWCRDTVWGNANPIWKSGSETTNICPAVLLQRLQKFPYSKMGIIPILQLKNLRTKKCKRSAQEKCWWRSRGHALLLSPAAIVLWQISMWASELFWRGHWQWRCETELDRKVADSSHGGSSRLRAGMLPCAGRSRFASLSKPPWAQSRWKSPLSLPVMKAPTH